jgi:ethanolamine utilization protein EutQ
MSKRLITQAEVIQAADSGQTSIIASPSQFIITPGARDKAQSLGITICDSAGDSSNAACASGADAPAQASGPSSPLDTSMIQQVCDILSSRLPAGTNKQNLERIVGEVVAAKLGNGSAPAASKAGSGASSQGVCLVKGDRLMQQEGGKVPIDEKVLLADAIQCGEGHKMAGGFMQWEKASFRREVEASEMAIVLDGELHLTVGGETLIGRSGDMIYFPKGAKVLYSAPGKVRLACVNCIQ